MSNIFQSIAKSSNIRQSGALPAVMAQAEQPQQPMTSAYEGMVGGIETAWVVILTALEVEHKAVEAHLEPFGQDLRLSEKVHQNGTIYTTGRFATSSCNWNVAIAQINMGSDSAAIEATRAIEQFNPRVILFVGVAGGIKDVEIGDVVAGSVVYNYECGKVLRDRTLPRPKLGEADYDLQQRAQAEARKDDWRGRIRPGLTSADKIPKASVNPIAAGNKVIASPQSAVNKYLQEYYDDAIAVEMEGFGFLKATQQVKNVSAIVIRGISNLIGRNVNSLESERIQQDRAARHASAFAFEVLAKLDGVKTVSETSKEIEPIQIDLEQTLPKHLTSLSIEIIDLDEYYIHAHHGKQTFVEQGKFAPLLVHLPELIESDNRPMNLVSDLDTCNDELQTHPTCPIGRFLKWLPKQISSDAFEEACLTIDDRTNLKIPWELLEVNGVPIGAAIQTIHQCPELQNSEIAEHCCQGSVLAYATTKTHTWHKSYSYQYHSEFSEFLGNLQQPQADYGLVFIDGFGIQQCLQLNPTAFIKRSTLFKSRSSLVFVNGRLIFDESVNLRHSMFLTLFLKHGAKGVIGSLKRVKAEVAAKIVETFFMLLEKQPQNVPMTVPAILRQMRQQAYQLLNTEMLNDEICTLYITTFLYVYYGNPVTVLELTPVEDTP